MYSFFRVISQCLDSCYGVGTSARHDGLFSPPNLHPPQWWWDTVCICSNFSIFSTPPDMVRKFIHWFISQLLILLQGQGADIGRGRGSPRTSRPLITGLTHRDKQRFTLTITPTGNLKSQINLEAGAPAENPGWHGENMQTPHRKIKPQPSIEPRTLWMLDELLAVRQQC